MQEAPISYGFLAFAAVRDRAVALGNGLRYFAIVFNGWCWLVVTRRDTDATWRAPSTLGWSKQRVLYALQNRELHFRTWPPGHEAEVDWNSPSVQHSFDLEAGTVPITRGVSSATGETCFVLGLDSRTVSIEVLPPTDASPVSDSVQWAIAATRNLQAENKVPKDTTKAELARLLEAEAQKAVRAGQLNRALKASYLENQLIPWGIWPLCFFICFFN
jgi:hypothetical protein